jgi:hypothetical protein
MERGRHTRKGLAREMKHEETERERDREERQKGDAHKNSRRKEEEEEEEEDAVKPAGRRDPEAKSSTGTEPAKRDIDR